MRNGEIVLGQNRYQIKDEGWGMKRCRMKDKKWRDVGWKIRNEEM